MGWRVTCCVLLLAGCAPELPPHDLLTPSDGGVDGDGGSTGDGGWLPDGGPSEDGGPPEDAGPPIDGGKPEDGGPGRDAGIPNRDGGESPFVGNWMCSGNQVESCMSGQHGDSATFTLSVTALSDTEVQSRMQHEMDTTTGTDYSAYQTVLDWNVSGDSATLAGPQSTVTSPGSIGGTWSPTYEMGSWALAETTLTWNASGTAVYVNPQRQTCSFTQLFTCMPQ
jgi:hypothetical protein